MRVSAVGVWAKMEVGEKCKALDHFPPPPAKVGATPRQKSLPNSKEQAIQLHRKGSRWRAKLYCIVL